MSNRIPVSAFRLARHHHHGWAKLIEANPEYASRIFEQRDGLIPEDIIEDVTKIMMDSNDDMGLLPSYVHTTGTGRTAWACGREWVALEIHRPIRLVGGVCGSLGVLRLTFGTDQYGLIRSRYGFDLEACDYAEQRHYVELFNLAQVLGLLDVSDVPHIEAVTQRILAGMDCECWGDASITEGVQFIEPWTPTALASGPY